MIITVTPNPALDITYRVGHLVPGESHRVGNPVERAGGKGLNTAGTLAAMGHDVLAIAAVGEPVRSFAADLTSRGIRHLLVPGTGATRRSVAVVDSSGAATLFNEAGAAVPDHVWDELLGALARACTNPSARVLTVSGSLPPDTPPDLVRRLVVVAHRAGLAVVLDISGPALVRALEARPEIVKPNRSEAATTVGDPAAVAASGPEPAGALARALTTGGARAAVVSDGRAGLSLAAGPVNLRAWLPTPLKGNATGAGDALTAALAADLDRGGFLQALVPGAPPGEAPGAEAWAAALRRAVAWSAAAVLQPVAGTIDPADVERLLPTVEIEETTA